MKIKKLIGVFVFFYVAVISGCISIHQHRYTKGFHLSIHGNVRENKTETNKASEKLKFTDAQGINLPYNEVPIIPNGHVQALPKNQTVRESPALSKRIRPSVQVAKASAKRFTARNSNQNTREQNYTLNPEQTQADLLYILALIAMVLLILLLLKNFPLLSLLLFIVALLLVLRYFDLI
jgi:hypothetical protein